MPDLCARTRRILRCDLRQAEGSRTAGTILVADHSATVRAATRAQLEDHGYRVIEAADGAEALRVCREQRPDVLLLEVELPTLDGYGVLTAVRDDEELRDIAVVLVTGRVKPEDFAHGLRLGADDYLRTPVDSGELLARVHTALRLRVLEKALNARNDEIERISRTDGLTALWNRRHLEGRLTEMLSAARRHDHLLGVLLVDVDHLKPINDAHGLAAGDEVLRAVARRMRETVRAEDAVGRWGGAEFMVLVEHATSEGVATLAERMRAAIETMPVTLGADETRTVTVSIGWCLSAGGADARVDTAQTVVAHADAALDEAKAGGRNRVFSSPLV